MYEVWKARYDGHGCVQEKLRPVKRELLWVEAVNLCQRTPDSEILDARTGRLMSRPLRWDERG